ncbi:LysR family transcriptional regulator substrate-binding protein [Curtobacterium aurantiacum]|uniref:LysR family transcriptional regulator substrate-binding protein n=1 Tax=Curtobacterium aurantiacum TaxID=3236919 RepID=A0ABS5VJ53_9MICO|nr:LysR family transcriptional regulator substrate-binding protein [Curtobacterium flaccumfaciens]MBT1546778.1 LysR family transcriptional regulator substrate-binding protein [Curtobacterium flaccumfaciens pv. flaccumfaciens]MBT1589059.1 LysR family transcriptional regulator substrate-binding protein [Curtobacterium flaccumfaciens pv. flaccumfaciens]
MTAALTIAFVPGVSPAKWARVWRERFPSIELRLRPIGADDVDDTLAGEADMVFARMPVSEQHNAIPLWTETAVVAMPKDSPLAELAEVDLADAEVHVIDAGPVPADIDGSLDLVEANVGVVVLPQSLFRAASRKDLVGRPLMDAEGTRIALVWRDEDATETTEEFIGVVRGRTANSSRSQPDQPGGTDRDDSDGSRPARGGTKAGSTGSGGSGASGSKGGGGAGGGAGGKAKAKSPGSGKSGAGKKSNTGKGPTPGRGKMRGKPSRGSKGNR